MSNNLVSKTLILPCSENCYPHKEIGNISFQLSHYNSNLFQANFAATIVTSLSNYYVRAWIYHASKLVMFRLPLYTFCFAMLVNIGTMASLPSAHTKHIRPCAFSMLLLKDFIISRITVLRQLQCVSCWDIGCFPIEIFGLDWILFSLTNGS